MIIKVKVKPNSSKEEIEKSDENNYEVYVNAKAEKGKANLALIKILAKHFNIPTSKIKIKRGVSSHNKIIEILEEK